MPPRLTIFGTVAVSTTRTHGVHFIAPKYSAASLISSGVIALAMLIIRLVFVFRDSALLRAPDLKSFIVCMKYETGRPDDAGVLLPSLAVRVVAEPARAHVGPASVRDDLRHLRVIAGEPVGRDRSHPRSAGA